MTLPVEDRLVERDDLPVMDGVAQVFHQLEPIQRVLVVVRRIDLPGGMRAFGGEHRHIGFLQHGLGSRAVVRRECNPDAGVDSKTHALELKRRAQDLAHTLRHLGCLAHIDER